jgi:hypothetical protein
MSPDPRVPGQWAILSSQIGLRLNNAYQDLSYVAGESPPPASSIAGVVSAGLDMLNAVMNAAAGLSALAPNATLAEMRALFAPAIQSLNVVAFVGNYSVDAARLVDIYASEGESARFQEYAGRFALQNAFAAGFLAGTVAIGTATIPAIALAGLGFAVGGFIYDFLVGDLPNLIPEPINQFGRAIGNWIFDNLLSPLEFLRRDPLSLDLDGDGIELVSLANSTTHFDLDGNGFAERTGWVSSDDGILVRDGNRNGNVDSVAELFGSATQDGFAVLETFDDNHDGQIDAQDAVFADLKVWRDLNQNGVSEAGELFTLAQLGIQSISVQTQDVTGTNEGHDLGVTGLFTRTDGTTDEATSIYFQTDGQNSIPEETGFVAASGVELLPQLPRSGNLHSTGSPPAACRLRAGQRHWMASNDATFRIQ